MAHHGTNLGPLLVRDLLGFLLLLGLVLLRALALGRRALVLLDVAPPNLRVREVLGDLARLVLLERSAELRLRGAA